MLCLPLNVHLSKVSLCFVNKEVNEYSDLASNSQPEHKIRRKK